MQSVNEPTADASLVAPSDQDDQAIQAMVESQLKVCREIESVLAVTPAEAAERRHQLFTLLRSHVSTYRTLVQWLPAELQARYGPSPRIHGESSVTLHNRTEAACDGAGSCTAAEPGAATRVKPWNRTTRSHTRSQSLTLVLGALGALFGVFMVGDMSYWPILCAIGALCLIVLAAAAQFLTLDRMANVWACFILSWPPLRDLTVLLLQPKTQPTTAATVAEVHVAFYGTRCTFFLAGILHHMYPKPLRWRVRVLAMHVVVNLLCTARMEYPHIGETPPVIATSTNEVVPFLAGFAFTLLAFGNARGRAGTLPVWPRAWARQAHAAVEPRPDVQYQRY